MNTSANVKSSQAIHDVKAALAIFSGQAKEAMTEVDLEIRRVLEWVLTEQPAYWQRQIRDRSQCVSQAKVDLMRCRMFRVNENHIPDCMEQKIALRKAEQRLEEAEAKLQKVRQWGRDLPQAIDEYLSQAQQLAGYLDGDLYRASAALDRMAESLEAYVSLVPPSTSVAAANPTLSSAAVDGDMFPAHRDEPERPEG